MVYQHYDVPRLIKRCSEQCKNDLAEIKVFELTTDMNNLPNSKGVRCYFLCFWIEMGIMKPGSVVVNPTDFFELMDKMTEDEQNKYIKLIKGCTKRLSKIKDPTEVAYQAVVCGKENSNEVSITRYYSARLLQTKCAIPYFCSLFSVVLFVLLMCLGLI